MDKKDKINLIISKIKETADELADDENTAELTAEETVIIATEMNLNHPITTIEYTQPIGIVDRGRVTFYIDPEIEDYEGFEFPLFGDTYYEEE